MILCLFQICWGNTYTGTIFSKISSEKLSTRSKIFLYSIAGGYTFSSIVFKIQLEYAVDTWRKHFKFFISLAIFIKSCVARILMWTAVLSCSLNLTVAATWNTMFTCKRKKVQKNIFYSFSDLITHQFIFGRYALFNRSMPGH